MINGDILTFSGLFLLGCLGMRHALDPDHVATVDGLAFGVLDRRPGLAPYVGTLFALGHGGVVIAIAGGVSVLGQHVGLPAGAQRVAEWSPVALLLLVGTLNLRALLSRETVYQPVGWKSRFFPRALRESTHPLVMLLVGVLFALMLDSVAQAAALGSLAAGHGGAATAIVAGLAFTVGMVVTATAYGFAMVKLLRSSATSAHARRYRRGIGWFTVTLAYGVAAYAVLTACFPALALSEEAFGALGLAAVLLLVVTGSAMLFQERRRTAAQRAIASIAFEPATRETPLAVAALPR